MLSSYAQVKAAIMDASEKKYDDFNNKIVNSTYPTVGVRMPIMRKIVKSADINKRDEILADFFADDEKNYETVLFAGMFAARKGEYEKTRELLKKLIPLFGTLADFD